MTKVEEEQKIKIMKKHLGLTCSGYLALGIGVTVQQLGIKAGLGLYPTIIIFALCFIYFVVIIFTSMGKIKEVLFRHDVDKDTPTEKENIKA